MKKDTTKKAKVVHKMLSKTGEIEVEIQRDAPVMEKKEQVSAVVVKDIEERISKEPSRYLSYSRSQLDQVKDVYAKGANDVEFANFIVVASRTGLDIFKKQIYLISRWDNKLGKNIFTPQTGIDGLRSIAERTDAYAGNDDPIFEAKDGAKNPEKATVTVYKIVQGQRYAFTASARWDEYYPGDKVGFMWKTKPHVMLGKCAEALALRKAFPNNIGGIYTAEEMAIQDAQIRPLNEKKVEDMFEKAKAILLKKTNPGILEKDLASIEKSEKYSDDQKAQLKALITSRINELIEPKDEPAK